MNLISRLKTESFARGMWLSVVFNILAKGILFLLTILLAAYFGSNIKTDIYFFVYGSCLLYTSPSPRDRQKSRMPSSA